MDSVSGRIDDSYLLSTSGVPVIVWLRAYPETYTLDKERASKHSLFLMTQTRRAKQPYHSLQMLSVRCQRLDLPPSSCRNTRTTI